MKIFFFLFISTVIATLQLSAAINVSVINGTKKISISLNELHHPAKIELLDQQGIILTTTKVKTLTYNSIFDLSPLSEGKYFLSILLDNKEWVQPLVIYQENLILDKKAVREYFSPVFKESGNKLDVIMLNQFLSPVEIQILNQDGQPVFNEKMGSVLKVEKRFDLSSLEAGTYTMIINANERNYYHTIRQ